MAGFTDTDTHRFEYYARSPSGDQPSASTDGVVIGCMALWKYQQDTMGPMTPDG